MERTIPATVRDAVLARAGRLSPGARDVLDAVAIAPPHAEMWLVEALSGAIDARLDECVASGVLVSADGDVSFRHELARLSVEESIPPARLRSLHRRALAALLERPSGDSDLARLAHHADAAGEREAVLDLAPRAADHASSVGAHREAADQLARALRYADAMPPAELALLLTRRAHECYVTDQVEDAIAALREASASYRDQGDRRREGATLTTLANILWCPGRGVEAMPVALDSVGVLEGLPAGRELVEAYATLSFLCFSAADRAGARQWATRAYDLAVGLDDAAALASAEYAVGRLELEDDHEAGRERLLSAREHAERSGREWIVAETYLSLGEIEDGLTYCREHGVELIELYLLAERAARELAHGLWTEATKSANAVLGRRTVSTFPATLALTVLAHARARRGDPDVAPLLEQARGLADPTGELGRIAPVAVASAEAAWLRGDTAAARASTDAALDLAVRTESNDLVVKLQAWRRRAGVDEPPLVTSGAGPYGLELAGDAAAAAASWSELGRPYEAALALADVGERGSPARVVRHAGLARRPGSGVRRGAPPAATRQSRRPARASALHALERRRAHRSGAGRPPARGRRPPQRRRRRAPLPLAPHRRPPCLRDPAQARARSRGEAVAAAGRLGLLEDR